MTLPEATYHDLLTRIAELESAIAARGQAEQRLREQNEFITTVLESLSHPFYVIDPHDYTVRAANSAAYTGDLPESITCYALTHGLRSPCTGDGHLCPLNEVRKTKNPVVVEHMHYDKEGSLRAYEVRAYPIFDQADNVVQIIEYTLDITQRKELEQLKDEFISLVSHELRTPLNHIKGFATTLLQTDVEWDNATQRDFLGSINREADRLTNLVEKILHLSRLESEGLPMEKELYQVGDLVEVALQRRRSLVDGRQVDLHLTPDLPPLFVDGREIEVVLINLIENAVKYSKPGTPIALNATGGAGQVVFSVSDQGPGIPAKDQYHIFERFYRVTGGEQGAPGGTGLGLAICNRIVKAHGGRIWVDSTPRIGACFSFSLPVVGAEPEA